MGLCYVGCRLVGGGGRQTKDPGRGGTKGFWRRNNSGVDTVRKEKTIRFHGMYHNTA